MDNKVQEITKWLNTELLSRFIEDSKVGGPTYTSANVYGRFVQIIHRYEDGTYVSKAFELKQYTVNVNFTLNTYLNYRDNLIENIVDSISKENIKMFGGQKFLDLPFEEQQHYSCQQLCEWRWLPDECGNILRVNEVPGQDFSYSATLVKYAVVLDKNRDEV